MFFRILEFIFFIFSVANLSINFRSLTYDLLFKEPRSRLFEGKLAVGHPSKYRMEIARPRRATEGSVISFFSGQNSK